MKNNFFVGSIYQDNNVIHVELDDNGRLWTRGKMFSGIYDQIQISKPYFGKILIKLLKNGTMNYQLCAIQVHAANVFQMLKQKFNNNPGVILRFK